MPTVHGLIFAGEGGGGRGAHYRKNISAFEIWRAYFREGFFSDGFIFRILRFISSDSFSTGKRFIMVLNSTDHPNNYFLYAARKMDFQIFFSGGPQPCTHPFTIVKFQQLDQSTPRITERLTERM